MDASIQEWQAALSSLWVDVWPVVATIFVLQVVSWLSLPSMPQLPESREKTVFMRGARWGGVALIAILGLSYAVMFVGSMYGLMVSSFFAGIALVLAAVALLPSEAVEGPYAAISWLIHYRRRDSQAWLDEWHRRLAKAARGKRFTSYALALAVLLWSGMAVWSYFSFDRRWVPMFADERLGVALRRELADPLVIEVAPMASLFEGPLYPLQVNVVPQTTTQQAERLAEATRAALARLQTSKAWKICVKAPHKPRLAETQYVPPDITVPEGLDGRPPRPRKW